MSEEIKAAAERLRRVANAERIVDIYCPRKPGEIHTNMAPEIANAAHEQDAWRVARAYLVEHPADSDEPLTEEWLRSVGGDRINHPCGFWAFSFTGEAAGDTVIVTLANSAAKGWRWGFGIDTIKFTTDGTRGAWRNVCGILGIPLTEPGAS